MRRWGFASSKTLHIYSHGLYQFRGWWGNLWWSIRAYGWLGTTFRQVIFLNVISGLDCSLLRLVFFNLSVSTWNALTTCAFKQWNWSSLWAPRRWRSSDILWGNPYEQWQQQRLLHDRCQQNFACLFNWAVNTRDGAYDNGNKMHWVPLEKAIRLLGAPFESVI